MITRRKRSHMILLSLVLTVAVGAFSLLFSIRPAAEENMTYDSSLLTDLEEESVTNIEPIQVTASAGRVFFETQLVNAQLMKATPSYNEVSSVEVNEAKAELLNTQEEIQAAEEAEEINEEVTTETAEEETGYEDEPYEEDSYEDYSYEDYSDEYSNDEYWNNDYSDEETGSEYTNEDTSSEDTSNEDTSYEDTTEEPSNEYPSEESSVEESEPTSEPEEEPEPTENEEPSTEPEELSEPEESGEPEEEDPPLTTSQGYTDLDYLAAICQIEAGYNYDGCLAVANVILNRLAAGNFGSSIYDIIYAPYQFAIYNMDYYLTNGTSDIARQAAQDALNGVNNVGSYLFFNGETWLDPATLSVPYVVIGGNVFY